jgi:hypothetical protein
MGGINSNDNDESQQLAALELRKKISSLTLRRLWNFKANEDLNYFIVDDQYDNNFDIQAAERAIQFSTSLFNNEYTTIRQQIQNVAKLLNLEIFANTQGHIEVRPPQYNRVPSSVFFNMFKEREAKGIKVFPEFLERLFFNQIQGIINRIEIIEDQIRLRAVALGVNSNNTNDPDKEIRDFLASSNGSGNSGNSNNLFVFLTDPNTGRFENNVTSMFAQSNPEKQESDNTKSITEALRSVQYQTSKATKTARLFDTINRVSALRAFDRKAANNQIQTDLLTNRASEIRQRLFQKTGRKAPTINDLFSNSRIKRFTNTVSRLDGLGIVEQIGGFINERQKLVVSLSKATKNLEEGLTFNANNDSARSLTMPYLSSAGQSNKAAIPDVMTHMIIDEDEDDLGINSSKRFYLKASMYNNLTITEVPPPFNIVTVNGLLGDGFVQPPGGLQTSNDGNAVTSAYAVDYDSWQQYGFRAGHTISAPFFSDPDSQCAPYAVFQLLQARKNILQGSVTVNVYNEFYQPGDVVYIEDRDLLFYVTNISHNFSYGNLSTTLTLKYGHPPGEYLPTILDVVGKLLYNAKGVLGEYRSTRFRDANADEQSVGSFITDTGSDGNVVGDGFERFLSGPRGESNKKLLGNLLLATSGGLNPAGFTTKNSKIELRIYSINGNKGADPEIIAGKIRDYLSNPSSFSNASNSVISEVGQPEAFKIPRSKVVIREIDIVKDEPESPSFAAWNSVRELLSGSMRNSSVNDGITQEDTILRDSIIDAFVVFEDATAVKIASDGEDQASQESTASVNAAKSNARNSVSDD